MGRKATNQLLQKAKKLKSDEFYTQLADIEREMQHYKAQFREKVVYCNCDDPERSNFYRYFSTNFNTLGLKKLMASCYRESPKELFEQRETRQGICCEYRGERDKDGEPIMPETKTLKGDGDFRSKECEEMLKEADIVVTNPPFSLFREYVAQLAKFGKRFLIIGNLNAITYKEIFAQIKLNKMWLGVNLGRGISGFIVPERYELYGTEVSRDTDGNPVVATNNCMWLTNLELERRHERLKLEKHYRDNEDNYRRFDNCDGINIDKTQDIPCDYDGLMGVPITFLHKYNPDQFEIVRFRKGEDGKDLRIDGKCPYFRILIKHKQTGQAGE